MLNRPFILTLLFIAISIGLSIILGIIFAILGMKNSSGMSAIVAITSALCVGQIYANKYRVELPRAHKIKITLYYFMIQLLFSLMIIGLVFNSKAAGVSLNNQAIGPMLTFIIFLNVVVTLFIYPALGRGCRTKLRQLEKEGIIQNQIEPQV